MATELFIVHGMPGAGKSTLSKKLLAEPGLDSASNFSIGEHLRSISDGKISSRFSSSLTSERDVLSQHGRTNVDPVDVFEEHLDANPSDGLLLLDAFPRYPDVVPKFNDLVHRRGAKVLGVCNIVVTEQEAARRLRNRNRNTLGVRETSGIITRRIADHRENVGVAITALASTYPYLELDGATSSEDNAAVVAAFIAGQRKR